MQETWLLETEVFQNDLDPFVEELNKRNKKVIFHKFGKSYEDYYLDKISPLVFLGSIQFAQFLNQKYQECVEFGWQWVNKPTFHKYDCNYYYPRFKTNLLNEDYFMVPAGDVERQGNRLIERMWQTKIFVRPSSQLKSFNGTLISSNEEWHKFIKLLKIKTNPEDLVVIAPFVMIEREWRLVISKNQIITGSQYKENGEVVRVAGLPENLINWTNNILTKINFNPDSIWILDICENREGFKILEVGPFACCGLYKADPIAIINIIDKQN